MQAKRIVRKREFMPENTRRQAITVLTAINLILSGSTLAYVRDTEHRLTALETELKISMLYNRRALEERKDNR